MSTSNPAVSELKFSVIPQEAPPQNKGDIWEVIPYSNKAQHWLNTPGLSLRDIAHNLGRNLLGKIGIEDETGPFTAKTLNELSMIGFDISKTIYDSLGIDQVLSINADMPPVDGHTDNADTRKTTFSLGTEGLYIHLTCPSRSETDQGLAMVVESGEDSRRMEVVQKEDEAISLLPYIRIEEGNSPVRYELRPEEALTKEHPLYSTITKTIRLFQQIAGLSPEGFRFHTTVSRSYSYSDKPSTIDETRKDISSHFSLDKRNVASDMKLRLVTNR